MQIISELKNITGSDKIWKIEGESDEYKLILPQLILYDLRQHKNMIRNMIQAGYTNIAEYEDETENEVFLICEKHMTNI